MRIAELTLLFERLVFCFEFFQADDPGYALGEVGREGGVGDCVFELALRFGGYEAYGCVLGYIEGVRKLNLSWFEVVLVGYKLLSGEDEPYRLVSARADIWRCIVDG